MEDIIENEFRQIREIIEESLVGETIYTLAQSKPNHIVAADEKYLLVKTTKAKNAKKVKWELVWTVYNALVQLEEISKKDVQQGIFAHPTVYRCSFIFALLARFTHIESCTRPLGLLYHKPYGKIQLRRQDQ